jgi:Zn-dependent protease
MGLFSRWINPDYWIMVLLALPGMLTGLTFHEYAHAWAANKMGDETAKMMGRLTLNPLRHLNIIGTIAIVLFGFGWAKPVPISPDNFRNRKRGIILVSFAGPLANLILAVAFTVLARLSNLLPGGGISFIAYVQAILGLAVFYNLILALFNLIPIPPLDGSQILFSLIPLRNVKVVFWLQRYGFILLLVLLISGLLGIIIFQPSFILASLMTGRNVLNIPFVR